MAAFPTWQQAELVHCGVLVKEPLPEQIPHPRFPHSGRRAAVRKTARGFFAVAGEDSSEYFEPIPVSEQQLLEFRVSVAKLVELIAKQAGIESSTVPQEAGLVAMGQKHLAGYGTVEVYLAVALGCAEQLALHCLA
ncbi:MAG: hypothetical protein H5U08_05210, partial [Thermogutta sp.]|uniref:hypothetical protein n=1 Tax=Thermogutta sp. TaxID=1962930 RepID=UPI0019A88D92